MSSGLSPGTSEIKSVTTLRADALDEVSSDSFRLAMRELAGDVSVITVGTNPDNRIGSPLLYWDANYRQLA